MQVDAFLTVEKCSGLLRETAAVGQTEKALPTLITAVFPVKKSFFDGRVTLEQCGQGMKKPPLRRHIFLSHDRLLRTPKVRCKDVEQFTNLQSA